MSEWLLSLSPPLTPRIVHATLTWRSDGSARGGRASAMYAGSQQVCMCQTCSMHSSGIAAMSGTPSFAPMMHAPYPAIQHSPVHQALQARMHAAMETAGCRGGMGGRAVIVCWLEHIACSVRFWILMEWTGSRLQIVPDNLSGYRHHRVVGITCHTSGGAGRRDRWGKQGALG